VIVRNTNDAMMAPIAGSDGIYVWRVSSVRRSVLCWRVWQEFGFSSCENVLALFS
jgi:hypothetical protein